MINVLIVDDSPVDRALAGGLITRRMDSQIHNAQNGREGLQQIERHPPDLVLTDLQMPEMNGLELVTAIKDRFPNIPVILMTAQGSEEIAAQALQYGAASYVPKRCLAADLVPTMLRVLATSHDERHRSLLMHHLTETDSRFTLPSDPDLPRLLVCHVLDLLRCVPLGDETERLRVGIALEEALNNALYHGSLQLSADGGPRDRKVYEELARQRYLEEPWCHRKIHVRIQISPTAARFEVRDEGFGFPVAMLDQASGAVQTNQSFGRGIVLMRSIMDEVNYNDIGNQVTLIKRCVSLEDEECID